MQKFIDSVKEKGLKTEADIEKDIMRLCKGMVEKEQRLVRRHWSMRSARPMLAAHCECANFHSPLSRCRMRAVLLHWRQL
jgi:hypothetical protein